MDHRRYGGLPTQSETTLCQILQEAQHRWLRPPEVCEILRNYQKFQLTPDPPQKPQSGSLFLFDRKALRYFRKDGHNWRKKKDGKTVREAHERLKAGSVEVLHCYYAHGEDNENFQRRSYWMLDHNEHIVLVHYREVKEGGRSGMRSPNSYSVDNSSSVGNSRAASGISPQASPLVSPRSSSPNTSADWNGPTYSPECDEPESSDDTDQSRIREQNGKVNSSAHRSMLAASTGRPQSSTSALVRDQNGVKCEGTSSPISTNVVNGANGSVHPLISGVHGPPTVYCKLENDIATPSGGPALIELCEVLKQGNGVGNQGNMIPNAGFHNQVHDGRENIAMIEGLQTSYCYSIPNAVTNNGVKPMQSIQVAQSLPGLESHSQCHAEGYPDMVGGQNSNMGSWNAVLAQLVDNSSYQKSVFDTLEADLLNTCQQTEYQNNQYLQNMGSQPIQQHDINRFDVPLENKVSLTHSYSNVFRDFQAEIPTQHDENDTFRKYDSFGRWMSQDIGGYMDNSILDSTYWASTLAEEGSSLIQHMQLDNSLGMPVSHVKCFSITDFSPSGALSASNTKVIIVGTFTDVVKDPSDCKWSVMFGDIEVSAEVLQRGVLRCNVPSHKPGKVPFYITRDNKTPCSEVKEFEYYSKISSEEYSEGSSSYKRDLLFQIRLARMFSNGVDLTEASRTNEMQGLFKSLALFEEWEQLEDELTMSGISTDVKEQFIQKILKEKLQAWLLRRSQDGGKGAAVLDDHGLGVLHMGAALGYTWIIAPMLAAGVNVNFRDSRGWTALHWAAYRGREAMVVALMANGAAPGAKTDPTTAFPAGQTPADLASAEQHKGIAGYLAESSLTTHLSSLTLKANVNGSIKAVETLSEKTVSQQLPLQDTLAAVRNAAQAAARIHSAFRIQSFKRKEELQRSQEDEYGISNEEAQYIVAVQKSNRAGLQYEDDEISNSAAIRIQQRYRGWKGRKDFLLFRRNVVKIQAHFRGHQVRKKYKKIIWSVSIVEKAILRWRRKGKGLRGFEAVKPAIGEQNGTDDDFLKAGRKQIEAGLEKALARVQSMVKSPEAQEQYRRLLEGYQKTKTHTEGGETYPEDQTHTEDFPMSTYT